ncbi:hypothetical protein Celaphus_00007358, partial [Cervus elaphus hippelaphus]
VPSDAVDHPAAAHTECSVPSCWTRALPGSSAQGFPLCERARPSHCLPLFLQGDDSLSAITFDSDSETKAKRKSFHKPPPTSLKSPYHSKPRKVASWRSLRTVASMPLGGRMSLTPQKLCLGSSKQGYVPGTLIYREKEDMYDEIIELKKVEFPPVLCGCQAGRALVCRLPPTTASKAGTCPSRAPCSGARQLLTLLSICVFHPDVCARGVCVCVCVPSFLQSLNMQKSDVDLMRTKLRRLEEENSRKDRQIEQLLDASRGPDFVRTLADKRPDTGWVINGLKQRVLKLEQRCKEKDNMINKLQTDVKTTSLEEMRIAMETYYEEASSGPKPYPLGLVAPRPPVEKKVGLKRQKKMGSALLSLSRSVQELMEENQSLKEDLDRVLSNSPTTSKITGYADWSKPRLVRRIAELEKKLSSMESAKPQASEGVRSASLTPSASSPTVHLQESERLRGAVQSLTGERAALHSQLQERDLEVKQLLQTKAELEQELESVKEGERERREREKVLREELQALTRKFRELEGSKKEEEDEAVAVAPEPAAAHPMGIFSAHPAPPELILLTLNFLQTREEPQPPSPTASPSQPDAEPDKSQGGSSQPPSTCPEGRRDAAARVLQRRWRGCQHQVSGRAPAPPARADTSWVPAWKERALLDEDSPKPRVPSPAVQAEGDSWQEEAVTIIQSAFRAHLARARYRLVPLQAPVPGHHGEAALQGGTGCPRLPYCWTRRCKAQSPTAVHSPERH